MTANDQPAAFAFILCLLGAIAACGSEAPSNASAGSIECAANAVLPDAGSGPGSDTGSDEDLIVVSGDDAPCDVRFELVLELDGSDGEVLPRPPIVAGPGGRWLTATYEEGEFAVWSPSGALERRIGVGSGDGPGEFGRVSDLVVDSAAGTVHVFSNSPRVEVFSLDGDHLEGIRLPTRAGFGVQLDDGRIAATPTASGGARILLMAEDSAFLTGPARRFGMPPILGASESEVWSVEAPWYQLDRHRLPGGAVDLSIRRDVDWFPTVTADQAGSAGGSLLMGFAVDSEQGLAYTRVVVSEPAPPRRGFGEQLPPPPDEPPHGVVEVFTLGGELIASSEFENFRDLPYPLKSGRPGAFWYRVNDDLTRSITIFRPVLVPAGGE